MGELITFWVMAPISVGAAGLVLFQRNAVHAALLLILNQFTLAVFFVLLDAEFLAAVQVIVYAGAIMVLFLFVIMFLGIDRRESLRERLRGQRALAVTLGALLVLALLFVLQVGIGLTEEVVRPIAQDEGNVQAIARVLFRDYFFPFEVTSVLLIVAAIAAMVLARRSGEAVAEDEEAEAPPGDRTREPVS